MNRPLIILNLMRPHSIELILSEFCTHFLCPNITETTKNLIIPSLRNTNKFPYDELLRFLNNYHALIASNNVLYCVLALEPIHFGESCNYFLG